MTRLPRLSFSFNGLYVFELTSGNSIDCVLYIRVYGGNSVSLVLVHINIGVKVDYPYTIISGDTFI